MIRIVQADLIPIDHLPLIALTDDLKSPICSVIKSHTGGDYGHAMTQTKPGYYDSQNFTTFKRVPVSHYARPHIRIKYWSLNVDAADKRIFTACVEAGLSAPWWRRFYDYPGILGQLVRQPWIQSPFRRYCSERVADPLRAIGIDAPLHEHPVGLNAWMESRPDLFTLYGYQLAASDPVYQI